MVDVMTFANKFKPCKRKGFEAYVCKVPAGSCLLDTVKDYQIVQRLDGKTYLSPKEVKYYKDRVPAIWQVISSKLTTPSDFIISINGVLSKILYNDLVNQYNYADGKFISRESILMKSYICEKQFGVLTPINMTYNRAYERKKGTVQELEQVLVMNWTRIVSKSNLEEVALPVVDEVAENYKEYVQNDKWTYFIVAQVGADGQPIRSTMRFMDNETFSYIYDCRSWSQYYIKKSSTNGVPRALFKLGSEINTKKSFADVMIDYIESHYIDSMANRFEILKDLDVKKVNDSCVSIEYLQSYEHAGIMCFIYKWGNIHRFAIEYKDYFNEVYDGDIKKHLKHLESKKFVLINEEDFQVFRDLVIGFLNLTHSSVVSNYFSSRLTSNEFMSLKMYTGQDYGEVNDYLRGLSVEDPFKAYIRAVFISDIVSRSVICKDIYHFRGINVENKDYKEIKEGYVMQNPNFISTSIATPVALSFASVVSKGETGIVIVFKNTQRQHGMYLNNISVHRDTEFEVLFDVNYDLKFVRQLGNYSEEGGVTCPVWLCEIVNAGKRGIKKYQYQKDAAEKLVYMIQQDRGLMKNFYIESVDETKDNEVSVILSKYNTNDIKIKITLLVKERKIKVDFTGNAKGNLEYSIQEKGYEYMFKFIYHVMSQQKELKTDINKSILNSFSERFMFDLTSLFLNNNFIITRQTVNKAQEFEFAPEDSIFGNLDFSTAPIDTSVFSSDVNINKPTFMPESKVDLHDIAENACDEVVSSEFTLVGNDMTLLTFNIDISQHGKDKLKVSLGVSDTDLHQEFSCSFDDRLELFEKVYNSIVNKFELDCTRRLKRIFSIVSGYEQREIRFHKGDDNDYTCFLGDKVFVCTMRGSQITVRLNDKEISFDYFDNIYDSASLIYTIL